MICLTAAISASSQPQAPGQILDDDGGEAVTKPVTRPLLPQGMSRSPYDFAEQLITRSTAAACTAGPPAASGAVHDAPVVDPKPLQLLGPPSADAKGGPEKLPNEDQTSALLEVVT
jgi:hypothetical protein